MRLIFLSLLFLCFNLELIAQCLPDFSLSPSACLNERINIDNTSTDLTDNFIWDFCTGDLENSPSGEYLTSSYASPSKVEIIEVNNEFYGFFFSRGLKKLYRMNFGSDPNSDPTFTDLGDLGLNSNGLLSLEIVVEGALYYGLIIDYWTSKLYRISFGDAIENLPGSVTDLGTFSVLNSPIDLVIEKDESTLVAFVANYNISQLVQLNFGTSITNTPLATSIPITGGSLLAGFDIQRDCDNWYGLLASQGNNKIFKISFGTSLSNPSPAINELSLSSPVASPSGISFLREGDKFYGVIQSFNSAGTLSRLKFSSLSSNAVAVSSYGNLGVISNNWALSVYEYHSEWYGFSTSNNTSSLNGLSSNLNRFKFSNNCGASTSWYEGTNPPLIQYSLTGNYNISLTSTSSDGNVKAIAKPISVSSLPAPQFSIATDDISCINTNKTFALNPIGTISSASWNFGDGNVSNTLSVSHTYASSGIYEVTAIVTAMNGCNNNNSTSINMFDPPIASFDTPIENPLCTNQTYNFINTSQFQTNSDPIWEWFVEGTLSGTEKDFNYLFSSMVSKNITLRATIPGCISESSVLVDDLLQGPIVDFNFNGRCQNAEVLFASDIQGDIQNLQWDFGDGGTSVDPNPVYSFDNTGSFNVTLQANSINGCQNTKTKPVPIYSLPLPNFQLSLPPFSCSGSPSQFTDTTPNPTDSNITSWLWQFNDSGSSDNTSTLKNPVHTYASAGQYDVTLTATTNYSCENSITKSVTITQSPLAEILNTPACDDVPVTFTTSSQSDIKSWSWQIGVTQFTTPEPVYVFNNPGSYTVNLDAVGNNNCIASTGKNVVVPLPLVPDFTVQKNCAGQEAEFTDATVVYEDPVSKYNWDFGDAATGEGSPVRHTYVNTGPYGVMQSVTTVSGCNYKTTKSINVGVSPTASFTALPEVGVPPLSVTFNNTSSNANHYFWNFNDPDNSTSTEVSPQFTFLDYGNYVVDLTAFNAQNCSHTFSKVITAALPLIDVGLENLTISENINGLLTAQLIIHNKGNVTLQNLNLKINLSGIEIQQTVNEPVPPYSSILYTLDFNIVKGGQLEYLCVEARIEGDNNSEDNTLCSSIDNKVIVMAPYPNPSPGNIHLDWVSPADQSVQISIYDPLGKMVFENGVEASEGFNDTLLNLEELTAGVYFLVFRSAGIKQTQRFVIQR